MYIYFYSIPVVFPVFVPHFAYLLEPQMLHNKLKPFDTHAGGEIWNSVCGEYSF